MRVADLMTPDVATVSPEASVKEVADLLVARRITGVPVVDGDGTVVGVVSDSDLLHKEEGEATKRGVLEALLAGDPWERAKRAAGTAGEAMSTPPVTIGAGASVAEAARTMLDEGVRRLPVLRDRALVGIVTRGDLMRAFARSDEEIAREIREDVILRMHWISPARVEVRVEDGRVSMRGQVENRDLAESIAFFVSRVPGVVAVDSSLGWRSAPARGGAGR